MQRNLTFQPIAMPYFKYADIATTKRLDNKIKTLKYGGYIFYSMRFLCYAFYSGDLYFRSARFRRSGIFRSARNIPPSGERP